MDDKVERIIGIIGDPSSWKVSEEIGELVLVDVPGRPGAKQKMNKKRAIELGLWKDPETGMGRKAQPAARNKMRKPPTNKSEG